VRTQRLHTSSDTSSSRIDPHHSAQSRLDDISAVSPLMKTRTRPSIVSRSADIVRHASQQPSTAPHTAHHSVPHDALCRYFTPQQNRHHVSSETYTNSPPRAPFHICSAPARYGLALPRARECSGSRRRTCSEEKTRTHVYLTHNPHLTPPPSHPPPPKQPTPPPPPQPSAPPPPPPGGHVTPAMSFAVS
jgi:hypothetical protein